MRQLFLILVMVGSAQATTWYATSSSVNINAANLWVPTSTGTCTGSGTALTWGSQANGDTFNANGCTALAVNVDPGSASVQVTLSTVTNGGGFTYATATNITIHANILAGTTAALVITGSTGGGTIIGNATGGTGSSSYGISTAHNTVTLNMTGDCRGGSGSYSMGCCIVSANGGFALTGDAYPGSSGSGVYLNSNLAMSLVNVWGSDTALAVGLQSLSASFSITVTGNVINGKVGAASSAGFRFVPANGTKFICYPKDASYAIGTEDCTHTGGGAGLSSHATEVPINPGSSNVATGVNYGSFVGTLAGGGGVYGYPIQ